MTPDDALARLEAGGYYYVHEFPARGTFGIDTVDCRAESAAFRGVKCVPRGVHFISTNAAGSREGAIGEFVCVEKGGDVIVRAWDAALETLAPGRGMAEEDAERLAAATRDGREFDGVMAPYSIDIERAWTVLSTFVTTDVLDRCGVGIGTRVVAGDPDAEARSRDGASAREVTPYFDHVPRAPVFTDRATSRNPHGMPASDVTVMNTYPELRLKHAIGCFGADGWRGMLGELQLSFILLSALSSLAALEQWKRLVHVICSCAEVAVFDYPELYSAFIDVIRPQLERAGGDFFDFDDYTKENFLRPCLIDLARINIDASPDHNDGDEFAIDIDDETKLAEVAQKLQRLVRFVRESLHVNLLDEIHQAKADEARAHDAGEDAPVVVELSEGTYMHMDATDGIDVDIEHVPSTIEIDRAAAERMSWMSPSPSIENH
jgi:A1 cistron-splicing factor AAR2